jgi:hypothetical protein
MTIIQYNFFKKLLNYKIKVECSTINKIIIINSVFNQDMGIKDFCSSLFLVQNDDGVRMWSSYLCATIKKILMTALVRGGCVRKTERL